MLGHPLQALVFAGPNGIKENSVKLGVGEDLYVLFAGILTMRPWNRVIDPTVDHLVINGPESDLSETQNLIADIHLEIVICYFSKGNFFLSIAIVLYDFPRGEEDEEATVNQAADHGEVQLMPEEENTQRQQTQGDYNYGLLRDLLGDGFSQWMMRNGVNRGKCQAMNSQQGS
ncbi:hypothetical protein CCACVL1_25363 [Corchorus capsularis]|uniref:Uncharacterized protein n=1 Tax=Corchorus capsularis TaxID=210143 RepID=A0A1R3GL61_COCAP|nr:hypothetical protein CCACVL1_25363 [Corchorus capsularis]